MLALSTFISFAWKQAIAQLNFKQKKNTGYLMTRTSSPLILENMSCINSVIGTNPSSRRQVYIQRAALLHPYTSGERAISLSAGRTPASVLQWNPHQKTKWEEEAEGELSKVITCHIINALEVQEPVSVHKDYRNVF